MAMLLKKIKYVQDRDPRKHSDPGVRDAVSGSPLFSEPESVLSFLILRCSWVMSFLPRKYFKAFEGGQTLSYWAGQTATFRKGTPIVGQCFMGITGSEYTDRSKVRYHVV
ncbi:hypothetical protein KC338_g284 [Hortaea werneckii]|nr:hypothetical protein KC338_g284 [Hortaea werneckii]